MNFIPIPVQKEWKLNQKNNMRATYHSKAFKEFYSTLDNRTKKRIDYVLKVLREIKIVNPNLAKKLTNWEFYELLIEAGNTYRVIVFAIDDRNITLATKIVLLNGFIKKSNNYIKQLNRARTIIENFMKYEYEQDEQEESH